VLLSLANNMLDVARVDLDMLPMTLGETDARALVYRGVRNFSSEILRKGLALSCVIDLDADHGWGIDEFRFTHILQDLAPEQATARGDGPWELNSMDVQALETLLSNFRARRRVPGKKQRERNPTSFSTLFDVANSTRDSSEQPAVAGGDANKCGGIRRCEQVPINVVVEVSTLNDGEQDHARTSVDAGALERTQDALGGWHISGRIGTSVSRA